MVYGNGRSHCVLHVRALLSEIFVDLGFVAVAVQLALLRGGVSIGLVHRHRFDACALEQAALRLHKSDTA